MIERRVFCDVCKQPVVADLTILTIAAGPLTITLPAELHLCAGDAARFAGLIRGGAAELPELASGNTPEAHK